MEATTEVIPSHQRHEQRQPDATTALGAEDGNAKHWREGAKGSPGLTTAQSKMRWDHQPPVVIYSLCLATGLEVSPGRTSLGIL